MAKAQGSQVDIGYKVEVTPGTTPAGDWNRIRKNSESIAGTAGSVESGEIRSDRKSASDIQGNKNVGGEIVTELSGISHDALIKSAMYSAFVTTDTTATTLDAVASGNKITRASGSFVTNGFIAGQWALISGFSNAANNGWVKITAVSALELTVAGQTLANESGGGDERVRARYIIGGVDPSHLSVVKRYTDIDKEIIFNGCVVDQMAMTVAPEAAVGLTFTLNGRGEDAPTAITGDANNDVATTDPFTSFSGKVLLDNVLNSNITQIDLTLANNNTDGFVIGSRTKVDQFAGRANIEGTISMYFDNLDEYEDSAAHTSKNISFSLIEGSSYFGITLPRAYYDLETPKAGDEGPLLLTGPVRAKLDSAANTDCIISLQA